ncbi:LAMI_0H15764g1_1 [Lachancea mirantina]|uniref:LAMI_0H15764g1_1 n=1 Tax=Lachancea mirantina TaxID=1230905 RepID=A0A1G4KJ32_9SACH|nr:LAMI_0H15764g1_1 [Lachancea mirantina]
MTGRDEIHDEDRWQSSASRQGQELTNLDELEAEYGRYKAAESEQEVYGVTENRSANQRADGSYGDLDNFKKDVGETVIEYYGNRNGLSEVKLPEYHESTVGLPEYFDYKWRGYFKIKTVIDYFIQLFPILKWLPHYNLRWLYQDLVAGITVGCVLVPQSMSYAQIATLPPEYGLYSSFIGAFIYSFFATSKDVCIGPVAVMSLETAKVVTRVMARLPADTTITGPEIATVLALLCGIISIGLGLLRLGFLVELISLTAVSGFMTGSAFNIIWGQVPALMGYGKLVNTRESTYKVVISSLKHLPDTKLDAVFGLIPLVLLYTWKWGCNTGGPKLVNRYCSPQSRTKKVWMQVFFYLQAIRNAVVIIVFTAIAWAISRHKKKAPISLLGKVPSGLKHVGLMKFPQGLASKIAPELPASVIVLLLEHIAISKAFGRVSDYRVVPDQELVAIGATNLIGTFFNAYPATGSFSRSALKHKCNVSTPLSGLFSGCCVLIAIYCLTTAFRYIPKATLSAVIIHAVSDLLASYKTSWNFWKMNPLDFISFIVTVFITVFATIEDGIYFAMCWSCAMLLLKVAFPSGQFLGRVEIAEVVNAHVQESDVKIVDISQANAVRVLAKDGEEDATKIKNYSRSEGESSLNSFENGSSVVFHTKWVPLKHKYSRELNPEIDVLPPPPGVIVYRPSESFTYVNCSRQYDAIFSEVEKQTKRGKIYVHGSAALRPWNDPGVWTPPRLVQKYILKKDYRERLSDIAADPRPTLRIIAMDWSQVTQIDSTGIQTLVDLRKAVNKYADRQVEFHFSGIISPWIKRALIKFGFGVVSEEFADESLIAGHTSYHAVRSRVADEETGLTVDSKYKLSAASGTNTPFFHIEMPDFSKWDL